MRILYVVIIVIFVLAGCGHPVDDNTISSDNINDITMNDKIDDITMDNSENLDNESVDDIVTKDDDVNNPEDNEDKDSDDSNEDTLEHNNDDNVDENNEEISEDNIDDKTEDISDDNYENKNSEDDSDDKTNDITKEASDVFEDNDSADIIEDNNDNVKQDTVGQNDDNSYDAEDSSNDTPNDNSDPYAEKHLEEIKIDISGSIGEINELLVKSANGKNNLMAQLFGFSEILEDIDEVAQKAIDQGEAVVESIQKCDEVKALTKYQEEITNYKTVFDENRILIKQAKQNQDIEQLETELTKLLDLIKEYNEFLLEVL